MGHKKGKETIYVSLVAGSNPPELYLTDSEGHSGEGHLTTIVEPGDKVTWEIVEGSGISSITITKDQGSQDIFSKDPKGQPDGSWKGTISETASGEENYTIGFKIGDDDYVCDPILRINPD